MRALDWIMNSGLLIPNPRKSGGEGRGIFPHLRVRIHSRKFLEVRRNALRDLEFKCHIRLRNTQLLSKALFTKIILKGRLGN